jgi:hypothetical protein
MEKGVYYVCEYSFNPNVRDKDDPDVCLHELDFYSWNGDRTIAGHRLSLRKRISTGEYELYRRFFRPLEHNGKTETIICKSADLQTVLDAGVEEWRNIYQSECSPHRVCRHEYPEKAVSCEAQSEMQPVPPGQIVYRGIMVTGGREAGKLDVWKCENGEIKTLFPIASQKLWNHSDGFQWGYSGSGPAQLALALLLDATSDPVLSARLHQHFKEEFVAKWGPQWELSRNDILSWVEKQKAERRYVPDPRD